MTSEIIPALIATATTLLVLFLSQLFQKHSERKRLQHDNLLQYLEPLDKEICKFTKHMKAVLAEINSLDHNSLIFIDNKRITCVENVTELLPQSHYRHGANLTSTCFDLACLIARENQVSVNMPLVDFGKTNRNIIQKFTEEFERILEYDCGIYNCIQYDIGHMMCSDQSKLISYSQFVFYIKDMDNHYCLYRLFKYVIRVGNKDKLQEIRTLLEECENFHKTIEKMKS